MAWEARRFSVVASPELLHEYDRVLSHPDVASLIDPELLRAFRSHLLDDIVVVSLPEIMDLLRTAEIGVLLVDELITLLDRESQSQTP